jgi:hypothetical protein
VTTTNRAGERAPGSRLVDQGDRNSTSVCLDRRKLLVVFATFLRKHFDVDDSAMRLRCNLFADDVAEQLTIDQHWLDSHGLPTSSLRKSSVDVHSKYSCKRRANTLPYGTCELTVDSTRNVQTIYGSIQECGGFDRPE